MTSHLLFEMFDRGVILVITLTAILANFGNLVKPVDAYVLPKPSFELLQPRGIRISIPHEDGLRFFAFQGNLNKRIGSDHLGDISGEAYTHNDGRWTIETTNVNPKIGDVIHYWFYAQFRGTTYRRENQEWVVTSEKEIEISSTEKPVITVSRKLLFEENFNNSINSTTWKRVVKIPLEPDYEFVVYHNEHHDFLTQVKNGVLRITPLILEDIYGESATAYGKLVLGGCTSNIPEECSRKALASNILPPVISASFTTKDSFRMRYGKIEIRAKFPEGDWLYPELLLLPKYNTYGPGYYSGQIILGLSRGNEYLVNTSNKTIFDSRRLDFGIRMNKSGNIETHLVSETLEYGPRWTKGFHTYTTVWSRDGFQFFVDGVRLGGLAPENGGWLEDPEFDKMAPFDQEFYISIGVGVGGIRVFPDGTTSLGYSKPWKNVGAKAMVHFWNAKEQWLPSWKRDDNKHIGLEIDYIKVWS